VIHVQCPDDYPQKPEDHPDAWGIWMRNIYDQVPDETNFDAVFASEDYGFELAMRLNAKYIPFNRLRNIINISGTEIRDDPMEHWDYIPVVARPYFVKKFAIIGPTSAGKTTLTKALAREWHSVYVEEYARTYVEETIRADQRRGGEWYIEDLPIFAQGQKAMEKTTAYRANRIMFCDTDVLTTYTWWKFCFEQRPPKWMEHMMIHDEYQHTFVLSPDLPYTQDGTRTMISLDARRRFFDLLLKHIDRTAREYTILTSCDPLSHETSCQISKVMI
jgi:HTH-type transcriptional repressor of NAD biosynthesis genes